MSVYAAKRASGIQEVVHATSSCAQSGGPDIWGVVAVSLTGNPAHAGARTGNFAATAATAGMAAVAGGTVTSASGAAVPGVAVDLYAWPSDAVLSSLKPGVLVPTTLLGTATTSSSRQVEAKASDLRASRENYRWVRVPSSSLSLFSRVSRSCCWLALTFASLASFSSSRLLLSASFIEAQDHVVPRLTADYKPAPHWRLAKRQCARADLPRYPAQWQALARSANSGNTLY